MRVLGQPQPFVSRNLIILLFRKWNTRITADHNDNNSWDNGIDNTKSSQSIFKIILDKYVVWLCC